MIAHVRVEIDAPHLWCSAVSRSAKRPSQRASLVRLHAVMLTALLVVEQCAAGGKAQGRELRTDKRTHVNGAPLPTSLAPPAFTATCRIRPAMYRHHRKAQPREILEHSLFCTSAGRSSRLSLRLQIWSS